ncbi:MAG: short-chain fatty acyl-CoA regulator family protein [Alphaproteobacteria bacterium]
MAERKVMVGQRVRRLRRERGLTQAQMAERLGVSTSYLNLIERNQRPVTVQFLLKLGQVFDIDLQRFAADDEARVFALLSEVFSDPLYVRHEIGTQDIRDMAATSPVLGEAVFTLYRAYRELLANTMSASEGMSNRPPEPVAALAPFPGEEAQDFFQSNDNYFGALEQAAEQLWNEARFDRDSLEAGLRHHLERSHAIKVKILPHDVMDDTVRRFDRHGRRILLSEVLPPAARTFQIAYQTALLSFGEVIDAIVEGANPSSPEARRLLRIGLANYAAGAIVMPYDRFLEAAMSLRYDFDRLTQRFQASVEQVAYRLTTLQRPGAKGVPLFFVRMDCAGNVSRRYSAAGFHFARFGGLCPRWGIHRAFRTPGETRVEVVQMPDGATYFTVARLVERPGAGHAMPAQQFVVAIGCDMAQAGQLIYSDRVALNAQNLATPIGVNCRLCDRLDCNRRAYPPLNRRLVIDENHLGFAPYFFT